MKREEAKFSPFLFEFLFFGGGVPLSFPPPPATPYRGKNHPLQGGGREEKDFFCLILLANKKSRMMIITSSVMCSPFCHAPPFHLLLPHPSSCCPTNITRATATATPLVAISGGIEIWLHQVALRVLFPPPLFFSTCSGVRTTHPLNPRCRYWLGGQTGKLLAPPPSLPPTIVPQGGVTK